jgi:hypothetical protein
MTLHRPSLRLLVLALSLFLAGHLQAAAPDKAAQRAAYLEKIAKAEAIYNNACKNIAVPKVYKTVPDVEGILLMKVRPMRSDRELADPNWPGAAFGREAYADDYISSFLGYEHSIMGDAPFTLEHRGYIGPDKRPGSRPGYRWVDVVDEKDGKRYRYTLVKKIVGKLDTTAVNVRIELAKNPNMDLNIYRIVLDRQPAPDPAPRYGVTFEDHVIPEERALWLASSTVKVLDLRTNQMLGEMPRYAMSYVHIPSSSNPGPWISAYVCPGDYAGASAATRKFVDQVLIPVQEK